MVADRAIDAQVAESHESCHRFSVKVATDSHESSHPLSTANVGVIQGAVLPHGLSRSVRGGRDGTRKAADEEGEEDGAVEKALVL